MAVASAAAGIVISAAAGWMVLDSGTTSPGDTPGSADQPVTVAESDLLHRATERLIVHCMARQGFAYAEQSLTKPELPSVLDDVSRARKYGYGTLYGAQGQDANSRILARLTPAQRTAWHEALMGSGLVARLPDRGRISASDNGCTAEARRTLYGDLSAWYHARRIVDHIGSYTRREVIATPEYRTGVESWASCMRKRGYDAASPAELRHRVIPAFLAPAGEQTQRQEIAAAVAEADCGVSTGFSQTSAALEWKWSGPVGHPSRPVR